MEGKSQNKMLAATILTPSRREETQLWDYGCSGPLLDYICHDTDVSVSFLSGGMTLQLI